MTALFADTSYYLALLNDNDENDEMHDAAVELTDSLDSPIVTTAWILTEVADAFSRQAHRRMVLKFIRDLLVDRQVTVVVADQRLFLQGLSLFGQRPDKDWSLTDCISFVTMRQRHLTDALTTDHHFEQAGFTVLLE